MSFAKDDAEEETIIIDRALEIKKKDLIFLNNDIIFTKDWVQPINLNSKSISIPVNNQIFSYVSDCGKMFKN